MIERIQASRKTNAHPPLHGQMIDFSDGGMLFAVNESFNICETVTLSFDIGADETEIIKAEICRFERKAIKPDSVDCPDGEVNTDGVVDTAEEPNNKTFRYTAAAKFMHKCKNQKNRFYKYIIAQQREILRKQMEEKEFQQSVIPVDMPNQSG